MQNIEKELVDAELVIVNIMNLLISKQLEIQKDEQKLKLETKESLYLTVGQCNDIELQRVMLSTKFKAYQDVLFYIQKELNK